jgi:hypothetical protein
MPGRWLYGAFLAAASGAVDASQITALPQLSGGAIERGIGGVRCTGDEDGLYKMSRGAVLDLGVATGADVLLTTAHGLPSDAAAAKRKCRVLLGGRAYAIAEVVHAGGDLGGAQHDWAVIILERRIVGDVHRWRVGRAAPDWLANAAGVRAPVTPVLRRPDAVGGECRVEPQVPDRGVLFAHSCVAHPGTSGSPLVVAVDAGSVTVPTLIAIHIGTEMRWQGTKLDFVSVAHPIDAEVAGAIEAAARRIAVLASNERRRLAR